METFDITMSVLLSREDRWICFTVEFVVFSYNVNFANQLIATGIMLNMGLQRTALFVVIYTQLLVYS